MSRIPSLCIPLLVLFAGLASAQDVQPLTDTSRLLPVSGILTGPSGGSVASGRQELTFSIFSDAEGTSLLWTETQAVSSDGRGGYHAYLGAASPLPLDIFRSEEARWLQVSFAGRVLQRSLLVAVPYALRAADAETLGGRPVSAFSPGAPMVRSSGPTAPPWTAWTSTAAACRISSPNGRAARRSAARSSPKRRPVGLASAPPIPPKAGRSMRS